MYIWLPSLIEQSTHDFAHKFIGTVRPNCKVQKYKKDKLISSFLSATSRYMSICQSVGPSKTIRIQNSQLWSWIEVFWGFREDIKPNQTKGISALGLDRDLGFSRGHQTKPYHTKPYQNIPYHTQPYQTKPNQGYLSSGTR